MRGGGMPGGGMPGGDAVASSVARVEVPTTSAGEALRVAAYVVDLIGDERIGLVSRYPSGTLNVFVPEPFHAETAACVLGLDVPVDLVATGERAVTGEGAHSYWPGLVRGVQVQVTSWLRPGALPERRPYRWTPDGSRSGLRNPVKAVA